MQTKGNPDYKKNLGQSCQEQTIDKTTSNDIKRRSNQPRLLNDQPILLRCFVFVIGSNLSCMYNNHCITDILNIFKNNKKLKKSYFALLCSIGRMVGCSFCSLLCIRALYERN